jgi:puromycin-sensitive aminopeptidase
MTSPHRLPRTVVPRRYDLELAPDLATGRFTGTVTIALDVAETTSEFALHATGLAVELRELRAGGATVPATITLDDATDRVVVHAGVPLALGPASLALDFHGTLSDSLVGLYRSTFTDAEGVEHTLAATQFEAPHARRAFPCFDEPEFKAVFAVSLVVADELTALSNGPEIGREPAGNGRTRVRFGDTIAMSTYLVAFVIGELEASEPVDAGGIPLRVVHVPGKAHLQDFALEVGAFSVRFFQDYYGIPYPGEKLDLVALPDFAFGAMENLGCVTFRESLLLVDEKNVTQMEAAQVALTIVHEIAHMWFGDLVTMKWWNGIWLNEAFATFMEHAGVDALRPEWRTWDDLAMSRAAAMDIDALSHTRAVEYEVRTPEDAEGMFDVLTYQKGGSVVRMLEQWLGADAFRAGVRHYLDRYRYANTETTDLWDSLEAATAQPARRIMDSWIFQPGFPEVVVERSETGVRLSQRRFAYSEATETTTWSIPVLARVERDGQRAVQQLLLEGDGVALDVPAGARVVVNAGGEGFYRVAYPPAMRAELLDGGGLNARERFAIVDDAWAAVLAGTATVAEYVDLLDSFADEPDLVVWRTILARARDATRLVDAAALDALRTRIATIVRPTFERLGWDPAIGEDGRERQLRGLVLDALATIGRDDAIAAEAKVRHEREGTDPDVVAACIAIIADRGGEAEFDDFVHRFESSTTPQEQLRYLYALMQFPTEELVLRAAALASSDAVRSQNGPFLLQRGLKHRVHGPAVWEFVHRNWRTIDQRFPRTLMARMLEGITWLVDDVTARDVPAFLAEHPVKEGAKVIAQHLERQRIHRALWEREHGRFGAALLS